MIKIFASAPEHNLMKITTNARAEEKFIRVNAR